MSKRKRRTRERPESRLVRHEPCPKCGSRDNLARYDDGHAYCFGQGCGYYEPAGSSPVKVEKRDERIEGLIQGEIPAGLPARKLSEETCEKWDYRVGVDKHGEPVQIATYRDKSGRVVAQKLRYKSKKGFPWLGKPKEVTLFGAHLWGGGKRLVITEGEIDAMSVSQMQGNKWPVVSVINGASGAKRDLLKNLDYLDQFEEIVLLFDNDEPGQEAAKECAEALLPRVVKIATLPLKDANEMLQEGRTDEVVRAIWNARQYKPDGMVTIDDIEDEVLKPVEVGLPWCFPTLTQLTHGRRYGEIYMLGAGTGIGKTDLLTQQIEFDVNELRQPVGVFFLEQQPPETARRIAGKAAGKLFHVPNAGWTREELKEAITRLKANAPLYFFDHFGSIDWDTVENRIRYLAQVEGVRIFYVDHLTAFAAEAEDEKKELERLMSRVGKLVKALQIMMIMVSHLATPEGKPHEEGGRVMIRHFKGSRAIGFWSHSMFGLERDQQHENPRLQQITTFRILKERFTGQATGKVFYIRYDPETGRLEEIADKDFTPESLEDDGDDFDDETDRVKDF